MALFGDTPVKGNRKTDEKDNGDEIKMSVVNTDTSFTDYDKYLHLRLCPQEDQAGVTQAISPIWMKLGQIEGPTQ